MGLLDWLPGRRKRHAERIAAAHEAAITDQREQEADKEIRDAYMVAHRLAVHRRQNHFADRMRAAYGRQEGQA